MGRTGRSCWQASPGTPSASLCGLRDAYECNERSAGTNQRPSTIQHVYLYRHQNEMIYRVCHSDRLIDRQAAGAVANERVVVIVATIHALLRFRPRQSGARLLDRLRACAAGRRPRRGPRCGPRCWAMSAGAVVARLVAPARPLLSCGKCGNKEQRCQLGGSSRCHGDLALLKVITVLAAFVQLRMQSAARYRGRSNRRKDTSSSSTRTLRHHRARGWRRSGQRRRWGRKSPCDSWSVSHSKRC